jgi:hypothetical protein
MERKKESDLAYRSQIFALPYRGINPKLAGLA